MSQNPEHSNHRPSQFSLFGRGNRVIGGNDYSITENSNNQTTRISISIWISILVIFAVGGFLAFRLNKGRIDLWQTPNSSPVSPASPSPKPPASPSSKPNVPDSRPAPQTQQTGS